MNVSTNIHGASAIKIERKSSGSTTWTSFEIRGKDGGYHSFAIHDADPNARATITGHGDDPDLRKALSALLAECEAMHREYCPQCKAPCPTTTAIDNAKNILARE